MTAEFVMNAKYALIPRKQRHGRGKDRNKKAAPDMTKIVSVRVLPEKTDLIPIRS
jgi:hypothetical protein